MDLQRSPNNPGLGNLSCLPFEVRLEIWEYFSLPIYHPSFHETWNHTLPVNGLGFLRASRAIYNEASDCVYGHTTLTFSTSELGSGSFRLSESTNIGHCTYFHQFEDAMRLGLCRLPLSKFRQVVVEIAPPHMAASGSFFATWRHHVLLARLLTLGEHKSANITFRLLKKAPRWQAEPGQHDSASVIHSWEKIDGFKQRPSILSPDFTAVLIPFRWLRQFKSVRLRCSRSFSKEMKDYAHGLLDLLTRSESFGTFDDPDNDTPSDQNVELNCDDLVHGMCVTSGCFDGLSWWELCWIKEQDHKFRYLGGRPPPF